MKHEDVVTDKVLEAMDVEPTFARIIVKEGIIEKTSGGLYVPQSAQESEMQTNEGFIVAIGPIVDKEESFKVKDHVYYGRHAGTWFMRNGEKFRIMMDEDVLGHVRRK